MKTLQEGTIVTLKIRREKDPKKGRVYRGFAGESKAGYSGVDLCVFLWKVWVRVMKKIKNEVKS